MRKVTFEVSAFQDFVDWATLDSGHQFIHPSIEGLW
jgi:hypothetical protein